MLPCEQRPFDLSMKIKRPLIAGFINTPCKQIRENFACGIRNATQGIRNLNNEWKPIQVPLTKTGFHYHKSGIHGKESRFPDCLEFPYIGRRFVGLMECKSCIQLSHSYNPDAIQSDVIKIWMKQKSFSRFCRLLVNLVNNQSHDQPGLLVVAVFRIPTQRCVTILKAEAYEFTINQPQI